MKQPDPPPRAILVSLRPRFAQAISQGTKTVELRRRFPCAAPGTVMVFYVTSPVAAITGVVRIRRVHKAPVSDLWEATADQVGLAFQEFVAYFAGTREGFAVEMEPFEPLADPITLAALRGVSPTFRPPQSYRYIDLPESGAVTLAVLAGA